MVTIHNRQGDGPVDVPSASGLSATAITAGGDDSAIGGTLQLDTGSAAPGSPSTESGIPLVPTSTGTLTMTSSSPSTSPSASQTPVAATSHAERFSTGVVVAICVGAFVGAVFVIAVGVLIYRRSSPRNRRRAQPLPRSRRFSRDWDKLHHEEDHWETKYPPTPQTHQLSPNNVAPMEKLNMFKKSPSMRSGFTDKSMDPFNDPESSFDGHNLPVSHVSTNRSMADARVDSVASNAGPFLANVDTGPTLSWDMSFASNSEGGRISPMFNKAIPTPPATASRLHHAQSAEIIDLDGQSAEIVNPFDDSPPRTSTERVGRKRSNSGGNPFFGSRRERESISIRRSRSRSRTRAMSTASSRTADSVPVRHGHSRSRSKAASFAPSDNLDDMYQTDDEENEGYYTATSNANPFNDPPESETPTPTQSTTQLPTVNHPYSAPIFRATPASPTTPTAPTATEKSPVTPVNDPVAIKGLLDALDMEHSRDSRNTFTSMGSAYSEDVSAAQFPIPPGAR